MMPHNLLHYFNKKLIGFLLVFFATLAVYYITLAPTMFWIDAAIYLTAIKEFGIAYPPGFPLYMIIAKLWSYLSLPGFNFAQKINFLSSVFASLASAFLYLTILKIFESNFSFWKRLTGPKISNFHYLIAFFTALAFGFSHSLWYQATYSEVYTFHIFLTILSVYFLVLFATQKELKGDLDKQQKRFLFIAIFVFGISFGNHPMVISLIPFFIWIWFKVKNRISKKNLILYLTTFFLAGFSPYIYIPFRSLSNPTMDWGNPENFSNFLNHVTGRHWTGEAANFAFLNREFFVNIGNWFYLAYHQFFFWGMLLAIIGAIYILFKNKDFFIFLILIVLGAGFMGTVYITGEYESWLIPTYIPMAIFMATGFYFLWFFSEQSSKISKYFLKGAILFLLIFIVFSNLKNNWLSLDRSGYFYPQEVGHNILKSVPEGSIVITEAGMALNSILYNQFILGEKPGVIAIHRNSFWAPWMRQNLKKYEKEKGIFLPNINIDESELKNEQKRSDFNNQYLEAFIKGNIGKFTIYTVMPDFFDGIKIIPAGFGYRYSLSDEEPNIKDWDFNFVTSRFCRLKLPTLRNLSFRNCFEAGIEKDNGKGYFNPDDIQVQSNENFKEIKAGYASSYKNLADIYASKNDFKNSAYYYEKAVNLFNDNFSKEQKFEIYMRRGVALLNAKVYQEALESFREAEKISPKNEKVLLFLIISYEKIGMIKEALDMTKSALKIYPDNEDFSSLFVNILRTYPEATKF
ncbi:MAG: hypothetical protein US79_C0001G0009 [Parcubacteria group bacterium GW2011_GWC1_38_17]|nr:MAG: hypothetical protein US06_C0001G0009 [Parcubacteria group bacterium GW2011_GWC2_36_17]KKQ59010.1 MAG: hypothetical protein US79_C0001G0009 [Parcubacteria group bacterium GW2011_GWC1_38_17]